MNIATIFPQSFLNSSSIFPQLFLNLSSILPQLFLNSSSILPQFFLNSSSILPQPFLNLSSTLPQSFLNSSSTFPQSFLNSSSIFPQFFLNSSSIFTPSIPINVTQTHHHISFSHHIAGISTGNYPDYVYADRNPFGARCRSYSNVICYGDTGSGKQHSYTIALRIRTQKNLSIQRKKRQ